MLTPKTAITAIFISFYFFQICAAETPPEIEALQAQRSRKIDEINRIYRQELEKIKLKYTKLGNLDSANIADALIKSLDTEKPAEKDAEKPAEKRVEKDTRWIWGSGGELVLKRDGSASHSQWNSPGTWVRKDDDTILLDGPFGSIRITFKDEIGTAVHVASGNVTTLIPKN